MPTFEEQAEARLGVTFKNRQTLHEAFVHRSYMNEFPADGQESNERLEFFGDAVLCYVVAERFSAADFMHAIAWASSSHAAYSSTLATRPFAPTRSTIATRPSAEEPRTSAFR